jgi:hypothetical protein
VRLLVGAGAELDLEPAAREQDGDRGAPAPRPDHRGLAQRRQAAEPLPLQLDVRPDALGYRRGERGRRPLGAREGQRLARPQLHLARPDPPAAADLVGSVDGDWEDRRAGLEREPPDAALRSPEGARANPGALGEDDHRAAPVDDQSRRLHRGLVRLPAPDREGAEPREQPADPAALEQLDLGEELHSTPPWQQRADHERVEEAAVVGGDDHPALHPRVLAADALEPEPHEQRGHEQQPRHVVEEPVRTVAARVGVVALEALPADHLIAARRRRASRALVHALVHECAYTHTRTALLRARCRLAYPITRRIRSAPGSPRRREDPGSARAPAGRACP